MGLPKNNLLFGFEPKLTTEQRHYVDSIFDKQFVISNSIAGSGKTTLAVACAKLLGMDLVYIHAVVEEDKIGFTPGNEEEKLAKYHLPLKDALTEIGEDPSQVVYSEKNIEGVKAGKVWVYPMSDTFLRGSNLKGKKFIVIDEAQNFTYPQLRKILTRISDDCKVVMIGHVEQCDLKDPNTSGFLPYLRYFSRKDYVAIADLTKNFRGRLAADADVPFDLLTQK